LLLSTLSAVEMLCDSALYKYTIDIDVVIVDDCPWTKLDSGLWKLHVAYDEPNKWLAS